MTYESALEWAKSNLPMSMYDSYEDWQDAIASEFQTPELLGSEEFKAMLEDTWTSSGRTIDNIDMSEFEDDEIPEYTVSGQDMTEPQENIRVRQVGERTDIDISISEPIHIEIQKDYSDNRELPITGGAPQITDKQYDFDNTQQPIERRGSFTVSIKGFFSGIRRAFKI